MSTFQEKLEAFLQNYDKLKSVENEEAFLKEFMSLKAQSAQYREQNIYPADSGQQSTNRKKNRFKDIIPFEYTRVSLHAIEGVDGSDYVNANYIQGADGNVTYIAAQGPLPHTVGDFWRMLWYHNIEICVMACKLVEMAKPKCECYWPPLNETKSYGPITVSTIHEEEINNEFIIRDFVAECEGEKQQIRQYHYSSWPDHGRPNHPQPVLEMMEKMHAYRKRLDVPILVNCSAGCGRTGTIIAIDIARSMILAQHIPNKFSPHDIVESMRKQRPAMVQAKEQYVFVFMAMAEMTRKALENKSQTKGESDSRVEDDDSTYENLTTTGTPIPLPRNTSSSKKIKLSPHPEEGEERPSPVAPPRTHQGHENVQSNVKKSDKPSPPLKPKPRSTGGTESADGPRSGSGKPAKPVPPPKQPAPPPPPVETENTDSDYSVVDMSQLRDKGPEIAVVNEQGKAAPLHQVEKELGRHGGSLNTSRSILETIIDEVGDLIPEEEEEKHPSPPPPPAPTDNTHKWSAFEDEIPPPIPLHTEASKHILDPHHSPSSSGDPDHVTIDSGIYYTPTPHSIPMPGGVATPPSPMAPSSTSSPQRTPFATMATVPVSDSNHNSSSTKGSSKLKIFKGFGKAKSEKRKPIIASDIGKPSGMPRSPSDHALSSPPRGHSPSPDHGVSFRNSNLGTIPSTPANHRYTFPGEMGFGLRIPAPKGPRPEPPHWNVMRNNITAV